MLPEHSSTMLLRIPAELWTRVRSHVREQATRELQPLTRLPAVQWGNGDTVQNIRMYNVPVFSGGSESIEITGWLYRIFNLCQANQLTFESAINLMIQGSSGGASDFIEQMREEGKRLNQIVQQPEMRYGDL